MKYVFLAKIKNSDDRDIVKYIDLKHTFQFACNHYFSGLDICGACFCGFEEELREVVENHFDDLETILSKDDFIKLFQLNDEIKGLGFGIVEGEEKYNRGLEILDEFEETIKNKLLSAENEKLFEKVVVDEKEYLKNEYNLNDDEVNDIFENYGLDFKDRAIICTIFEDFNEMVEEEKINFGYADTPYFDDESFGNDLLNSGNYYELENGRIVYYAY